MSTHSCDHSNLGAPLLCLLFLSYCTIVTPRCQTSVCAQDLVVCTHAFLHSAYISVRSIHSPLKFIWGCSVYTQTLLLSYPHTHTHTYLSNLVPTNLPIFNPESAAPLYRYLATYSRHVKRLTLGPLNPTIWLAKARLQKAA